MLSTVCLEVLQVLGVMSVEVVGIDWRFGSEVGGKRRGPRDGRTGAVNVVACAGVVEVPEVTSVVVVVLHFIRPEVARIHLWVKEGWVDEGWVVE